MFAVIHFPENNQNPEIDPDFLCRLADKFSPLFEIVDRRTVAVNIDGLDLLFPGGIEEIRQALEQETAAAGGANLAIGQNLSQCVLTAFCRAGTAMIESAADLEDLPIEETEMPLRYREIFSAWGLKTVRDVVALPVNELISRLGGEIEPIIRQLTVGLPTPLKAEPRQRDFSRRIELDDPVEDFQTAALIIGEKLKELLDEAARLALAAGEIRLISNCDDEVQTIALKLPVPSLNLRFILKLLSYEMEKRPAGSLIRSFSLTIIPAARRNVQLSFWHPPFPDSERLELTLAKLDKLLGTGNVGVPEMPDSFNPRAFCINAAQRPESSVQTEERRRAFGFVVFRYFLKALPVRFLKSLEKPYQFEMENRRRKIRYISGPWISSGDWWSTNWERREMDVHLDGGQVYRVIERSAGEFFAEGYYD